MSDDLIEVVHGVRCLRWNPTRSAAGDEPAPVNNFGDLLGPRIIRRMLDRAPDGSYQRGFRGRVLSVGSVLHFARPGDVVWGAGVNGKVAAPLEIGLDIRAVRGPYSRCALLAAGNRVPDVFGDPALLVPTLWPELSEAHERRSGGVLVVPNLHEFDRFDTTDRISATDPFWSVVWAIASAEFVCGTSLHALIIADALGIPSRPIRSRVEHPIKYIDYYAGTGRAAITFAESVDDALRLGPIAPPRFDPKALVAAFPLDAWSGGEPPPGGKAQEGRDALDEALLELVGSGDGTPEEQESQELLRRLCID